MKKMLVRGLLVIGILLIIFISYFFLIRKLDNNAANDPHFYSSTYDTRQPLRVPSAFINGQRFYIRIVTATGDTLLGFGDTGGSLAMILPGVIDKLQLGKQVHTGLLKGIMPVKYIAFDKVAADPHMPPPVPMRSMIIRHPFSSVTIPLLLVPRIDRELKFMIESMPFDLFLGQNFFMDKAWTFDYLRHEIWVNTPLSAADTGKPGVQRFGLQRNQYHENLFGHPSTTIEVNGAVIDVLFDTGASLVLSEEGKQAFHTQERTLGGSFIAASIFDKWRAAHPDWKYYSKADKAGDVIEVPVVRIGGYEVGPVLFAKRPDAVWSEGMIYTMDKVVKGAIGGSALQYFKVTADYNVGLIRFER